MTETPFILFSGQSVISMGKITFQTMCDVYINKERKVYLIKRMNIQKNCKKTP